MARYAGLTVPAALAAEVERVLTGRVYERNVFFVRNQGFVTPTAARRIGFADSLRFERVHEQVYAELGFRLTEVPPGPVPGRAALIAAAVGLRAPQPAG
jgi:predicted ATPase